MKKMISWISVLFLSAVIFSGLAFAEQDKIKYGKDVGDIATPINAEDFSGKKYNTKDNNKAVYVIVNSVCSLCNAEMDEVVRHKDKFKGKADIYFVVIDTNKERAQTKLEKYSSDTTVLFDPDFNIGKAVNLYSTPSTLILDKGGKILYKSAGYTPGKLKEFLDIL